MNISHSKRNMLKQSLLITLMPATALTIVSSISNQRSSFISAVRQQINKDDTLRNKFSVNNIKKLLAYIGSQSETKSLPRIQQIIRDDFSEGDTLMIRGFIFAHTEIALFLCEDYINRETDAI